LNHYKNEHTLTQDLNLFFAKTLECSAVRKTASSSHCRSLYWIPTKTQQTTLTTSIQHHRNIYSAHRRKRALRFYTQTKTLLLFTTSLLMTLLLINLQQH